MLSYVGTLIANTGPTLYKPLTLNGATSSVSFICGRPSAGLLCQ